MSGFLYCLYCLCCIPKSRRWGGIYVVEEWSGGAGESRGRKRENGLLGDCGWARLSHRREKMHRIPRPAVPRPRSDRARRERICGERGGGRVGFLCIYFLLFRRRLCRLQEESRRAATCAKNHFCSPPLPTSTYTMAATPSSPAPAPAPTASPSLSLPLSLPAAAAAAAVGPPPPDFPALGIDRWLVDSLSAMAIRRPTPIQAACIPPILEGRAGHLYKPPSAPPLSFCPSSSLPLSIHSPSHTPPPSIPPSLSIPHSHH